MNYQKLLPQMIGLTLVALLLVACAAPIPITPTNAEQVVEVARLGRGSITQIDYAPDGMTLAVAGSLGVWLYDVHSLEPIRLLESGGVWDVAFSTDGQTLAETDRLWDVATGELKATLKGHTEEVWSVAFSPDGQTLASGSKDTTVRLWAVEARE